MAAVTVKEVDARVKVRSSCERQREQNEFCTYSFTSPEKLTKEK